MNKINKFSKRQILDLFRRLSQHMLTLINKNGTNPDNAKEVIEQLNFEINNHFGTENKYKVKLTFDIASHTMVMGPDNEETKQLFNLWWKFQS